ncbi:MAG: prohibitin family protein [Pseudomonadaceae bacterium]|jgi:regulator of protease activity HflC (stomatin/prohibitin superfamily)|nr:prohibitin family protein [Pseudomonadaceae bacterium]
MSAVNQQFNLKSIFGVVVVLLALVTLMGSWYTVDETERGVLLRNGALVKVVEPGLSFKIPFIETVKFISVQSNATTYQGLQAYSKDQQTATLNVSVSWHVLPAEVDKVYMQYQNLDGLVTRLISRQVPTQVENVFGQYNAVSSVQNRGKFVNDVTKAIKEAIAGPVVIDGVQIENIDFSDDYERSIALRMKAEVEVKTREQMLATEQVEAQIVVTRAQADADSRVAQAKADAEATRLRGEAEADAIKAKTQALSSNPALIELTKAERWDGKLPTTMLPNGTLPFIDAGK